MVICIKTHLKVNLVCMEESRTYRETASLILITAVLCSGTDRTAELSICCQISVCTRRTAVCIRMAGGRQLPSLLIQIMLVRGFQIQNPSVSDTKPTSSWTNLEMFKRFVEAETM